jgi:peptidoglycan/xylan/chitin deacetylase (PgdA/CDA1 family)
MLHRTISKFLRIIRQLLYLSGTEQILYGKEKGLDIIVMYHNIDLNGDLRFNSRHIAQSDFRKELEYYKKRFDVVPMSTMFTVKNSRSNRLAITFDDGLSNNYRNARPELEKLNIPATFFVTCASLREKTILWPDAVNILTHFHVGELNCLGHIFQSRPWNLWHSPEVGELMSFLKTRSQEEREDFIDQLASLSGIKPNDSALNDYHQLLSEEQIRTMASNPLFEIGSHAVSHSNLANLSLDEQRYELLQSKAYLEEIMQTPIQSLAFPDGSYARETLDIATECGYNYQLAVNYRHEEDKNDPRILDRFGLYNDRSVIERLHQVNQRLHEEH